MDVKASAGHGISDDFIHSSWSFSSQVVRVPPVTRALSGFGGAWVSVGGPSDVEGVCLGGHHLTDHRRGIRHWITSFRPARPPERAQAPLPIDGRRCRLSVPTTGLCRPEACETSIGSPASARRERRAGKS